jgi:hypothetical protein
VRNHWTYASMNLMKRRMGNGATHTRKDTDIRSFQYGMELLHQKEISHIASELRPDSILTANPATHQFLYTNLTTSSLFGRDGDELIGYANFNVSDSPAFFFDDKPAQRIIDGGRRTRPGKYMGKSRAAGSAPGHCSSIAPMKYRDADAA